MTFTANAVLFWKPNTLEILARLINTDVYDEEQLYDMIWIKQSVDLMFGKYLSYNCRD